MSHSEHQYIELCKKLLEEKFSFGYKVGYSRKDLELLSDYIEKEKGVHISLSTLKRVWKNNFKQGPQLATLNALVNVLDYKNWQDFKLQNKRTDEPVSTKPLKKERLSKNQKKGLYLALPVLIVLFFFWMELQEEASINGSIVFEADKTLMKGVPNTVIFNFDLTNVSADSFFIQQSWNGWRRKKIDSKQHVFSSIYYESGFHRAKLYANDKIIAKQPIHILSDGWEPHVYYDKSDERFIDFIDENFIENSQLHLSKELLINRNLDVTKYFETRVSNSQEFNVSSDNFSYVTRIKLDKIINSNCPWLSVLIVTEEHIFKVGLVRKGCESYADYKLGEIYKNGENNDLSLLGQDIFEWQEIGVKVKNKNAEIFINGELAFKETYKEDFGNIMALSFVFEGKGSIDYVKLTDADGEVAFEDNFD